MYSSVYSNAFTGTCNPLLFVIARNPEDAAADDDGGVAVPPSDSAFGVGIPPSRF